MEFTSMGIRSNGNIKIIRRGVAAGNFTNAVSIPNPAPVISSVFGTVGKSGKFSKDITDLSIGSAKQINLLYKEYFPKGSYASDATKSIATAFDLDRIEQQLKNGNQGNVYRFPQDIDDASFLHLKNKLVSALEEVEANSKKPYYVTSRTEGNGGWSEMKFSFGKYPFEITIGNSGSDITLELQDDKTFPVVRMEIRKKGEVNGIHFSAQFKEGVKSKLMQLFCHALYDDHKLLRDLFEYVGALPPTP